MEAYSWYSQLVKPFWAPPAWIFGPVWSFLYILIAFSFTRVFIMVWQKKIKLRAALPFILNLISNFSFAYIQFDLKNNLLATVAILLVLATLIWAMIAIFPRERSITHLQIPYLLWVSFATILQLTITYLN